MKNHLLKTTCAIVALSCLSSTWAILPASNEPLPNYDKRKLAPQALVAAPNPDKEAARAAIEARVPEVKISTDKVLGTPRMITARRGFLTGPQGQGGAVSEGFLQAIPSSDPHRLVKAFMN